MLAISDAMEFLVGVVVMFVLVLVVVGVALGNRDKLGIAERNEKIILHYFYAILEILYSTREKRTKKNHATTL